MVDYPSTLPMPDSDSYSGSQDSGINRTSIPALRPNQLATYNAPQRQISVTFTMTNDDYPLWLLWVRENGYKWFKMPVVTSALNTGILTTQTVRFISDEAYRKLGDNWLSVSVDMEILPRQSNLEIPVDPGGNESTFDIYIDETFRTVYGLDFWVKGYLGAGYDSASESLISVTENYVGFVNNPSALSTPIPPLAGNSIDSSMTGGVTVGFLDPVSANWSGEQTAVAGLSLSPQGNHNQSLNFSYVGPQASESSLYQSVMQPVPSRNEMEIERYAIITAVQPSDPNTSSGGCTIDAVEAGNPGANNLIVVSANKDTVPQSNEFLAITLSDPNNAPSPSGSIDCTLTVSSLDSEFGGSASASGTMSINGHAGCQFNYGSPIWQPYQSDYTFHVILKYKTIINGFGGTPLLCNINKTQGIYALIGSATNAGLQIFFVNDVLYVQHGENDLTLFDAFAFVEDQNYQIVVRFDNATKTAELWVNGAMVDSRTKINPVSSSAGDRSSVGRVRRASLNGNTEVFPLWCPWQQMYGVATKVSDADIATLYNEFQNAQLINQVIPVLSDPLVENVSDTGANAQVTTDVFG